MSKSVLVVSAHPDDEALGCAGVIAKHLEYNDKVHLLFMTDGVGSRKLRENDAHDRLISAKKAAEIMQVSSFTNLSFPDNQMDSVSLLDIVKEIEIKIEEIHPEVIYTHHLGDLNVDHQVTHKAVMTACRPQPGFVIKEIYAFEILSSTEWQTPSLIPFTPNVYIDITKHIDIKKQTLEAYNNEMRQPPHSRSIDNVLRLNALRGNSVGCNYAEAFMLLRKID